MRKVGIKELSRRWVLCFILRSNRKVKCSSGSITSQTVFCYVTVDDTWIHYMSKTKNQLKRWTRREKPALKKQGQFHHQYNIHQLPAEWKNYYRSILSWRNVLFYWRKIGTLWRKLNALQPHSPHLAIFWLHFYENKKNLLLWQMWRVW